MPFSGAAGGAFSGDVEALGLRWECKSRADGFRQLYAWLDGADALALKADRRDWIVALPLGRFLALVGHDSGIVAASSRSGAGAVKFR